MFCSPCIILGRIKKKRKMSGARIFFDAKETDNAFEQNYRTSHNMSVLRRKR